MTPPLRIATRGSALALWQAHAVRDALVATDPVCEVAVQVIRTTGDRILDVPLARIGDRGLFTKELDEALLNGEADIAVHSMKDVPTRLPPGLVIAAVSEREDPRDVLLLPPGRSGTLLDLETSARVGTSSLRRRAQLKALRPDLDVVDLRGNLNTRLARLDAGDYDAIVLAAAGVKRLGWEDRIASFLDPDAWLPAVGQGALAVVARTDDAETRRRLEPLHHPDTGRCVEAERAFLRALEGGCQIPIGALASSRSGTLHIDGLVAALDGDVVLRERIDSDPDDAAGAGERLAAILIERGALDVLERIRSAVVPAPPEP